MDSIWQPCVPNSAIIGFYPTHDFQPQSGAFAENATNPLPESREITAPHSLFFLADAIPHS